MWPRVNAAEAPAQSVPAWSPPPARPAAGRYAVPVALAVLALLVPAAAGLLTAPARDAGTAAGTAVTGDAAAGIAVRLAEGRTYFLYVRRDGSAPFGCAVEDGGAGGRVRLTRKNSWSAADRPGYRYTASMTAPLTGTAVLTCRGTDGPLLVAPDGTAGLYLGLALLAVLAACVAAAAGFAVALIRRSRADQRARLGAAASGPGAGSVGRARGPGAAGRAGQQA
ncbi:hypothetical protein F8568_028780 [Actinomadura sp. LD22]|uniref:Uncharacterized protein n=1 Tax=Actinomadura physcomitrii TaxID=2650748 RepID=A0A6I4MF46_9ACTN|nr:hypothetical protein [Actinomadura physcomitrii]MWA04303.1 hypothetical protein [Actinomadura physcomitrii]